MNYSFARLLLVGVFLASASISVNAQRSTWDGVYDILTQNCGSAGCHDGTLAGFDLSGTQSDVYSQLWDKDPVNGVALAKNNKLIYPGYPQRSFLLRKMANCLDHSLAIEDGEGDPMPALGGNLSEVEVEFVRQWILDMAPSTGVNVDSQLIARYYNDPQRIPRITPPAPPAECEGFQVHLGPIFFENLEEEEFFVKFDPQLPDTVEVNRLDLFMNDESHHYILRKYHRDDEGKFGDGLVTLSQNLGQAFDTDKDYVMAWQDNGDIALPNGTAYFWDQNTILDLNYHMANYNDAVLAGDVYMNVYTQPKGSAEKQMKADLINNALLLIPPGSQQEYEENAFNRTDVSVWSLSSHTHQWGVDYDIWLRKPNGDKGDQIFEGFYDVDYTFNQGFYDWEHPPFRRFEPMLDMSGTQTDGSPIAGMIHRAKYDNKGNNFVTFGFTTEDEMMIFYVQYVDGQYQIPQNPTYTPCTAPPYEVPCFKIEDSTGVGIAELSISNYNVFPNPFSSRAEIQYSLDKPANVQLEVHDMLGRTVAVLADDFQDAGNHDYFFEVEDGAASSAMYFIELRVDGVSTVRRLAKAE